MAAKIINKIIILITLIMFLSESREVDVTIATFNVIDFGANPNGDTDSSEAFLRAWAAACGFSSEAVIIHAPPGRYLITQAQFSGKCKGKIVTFLICGTIVAPAVYNVTRDDPGYWILFEGVDGVSVSGGTLDGQGVALWECKASRNDCPLGLTSIGFVKSKNVEIVGLTSLNSQLFHIVILGCQNVKLSDLNIMAAGNSTNTDGIHVQLSSNVDISDSNIGTGDDCVSIGQGTSNLSIDNVVCGPGHGISIGSLGKDYKEEGVENVTVKTVTFINTQNGARIKTWGRPSTGFVRSIVFQHVLMYNVQNPIIIDQNYCPYNKGCPGQFSGIKISDVTYEDIRGTSATEVGVKLDCSPTNPCTAITLDDVMLTYNGRPVQTSCVNADGTTSAGGIIQPAGCFE